MATIEWKSVPSSKWSCTDWVDYHKDLITKTGKKNANSLWLTAWQGFGNKGASSNCKSQDFIEYFKINGIDLTESALEEFIYQFKSGAETTYNFTKYAMIVVVVVILILLIVVAIQAAKNPAQFTGQAARAFATGGK
jgi:hypothetical protein